MRVALRPTVEADLAACIAEPLPNRIQTMTAYVPDTGEILGLGGLSYKPDGEVWAFAQILPTGRRYPAAVHRAGVAVMAMIRRTRVGIVFATASPSIPGADRWLLRLGFTPEVGGLYVWRRNPENSHVE